MVLLSLERVTKIFSGPAGEHITALREITLSIAERELLVVVGPSGCGKTTLLRLIAGLDVPTSGTITMEHQRLDRINPAMRRDIAMVFQSPALYPHMTAKENIAFGLKLRHCPRAEIERRTGEVAEMLGLARCLDRKPMALSSGQRQRVAIGRAIARCPKLLLYDEPLSNLDPQLRNQMRLEISKLHECSGTTTVYVTHDQTEAMILGQRIAVLNQGAIHQVDQPLNLFKCPADRFVAGFFGSPPMNFFSGTLMYNTGQLEFVIEQRVKDATGARLRVPEKHLASGLDRFVNREVILGIRPEHICPIRTAIGTATPNQKLVARLNGVDRLGAETHLHLTWGGHEFLARVTGDKESQTINIVELEFKMAEAHFFDPISSQRIGSKPSTEANGAALLSGTCAC